ncbi:MAG TPA: biotin-dependent carboxyltransferase family protein [Nitrospiraceae bacterium]|nr:biotin-dependent carboxyltransferase family protein [Nitrospiraceae bacterium]
MRNRSGLVIRRPGLVTTVQDVGRVGYQRYGLSVSGAMDRTALRIGNRLVGNPDGAAGLEVTLQGPEMEFTGGALVAITGADLSPSLNGNPLPMWTAFPASPGDILRFGARRHGCRAYVCFSGGLDVPMVFGSRSTDVRAGIGGLDGRRLRPGDELCFGPSPPKSSRSAKQQPPFSEQQPEYPLCPALRVVRGPQAERFSSRAMSIFLTSRYVVSVDSNRMGYRLDGEPIPHRGSADMISDATAAGTIQIPADEQPILLMADCQTTGGYPKIASVITIDMAQAAQLAPGDQTTFTLTTVDAAILLCRRERDKLDRLLPPIPPGGG